LPSNLSFAGAIGFKIEWGLPNKVDTELRQVVNHPNLPIENLSAAGQEGGLWVEVTVPYVDLTLDNPPPRSPWLNHRLESGFPPRLYYSQVVWIDQIRVDEFGLVWYRINEK